MLGVRHSIIMQEEKKSKLDNLESGLYSHSGKGLRRRLEVEMGQEEIDVPDDFNVDEKPRKMFSLSGAFNKFLIFSVIFFFGALGFAAFMLYGGGNITISPKNVDIQILGPVSAPSGQEISYRIAVTNKNKVPLERADLTVEFPEGTRAPDNLTETLRRHRASLGSIAAGDTVNETVRLVFFGEEGIDKILKVALEYRIKDSNAVFKEVAVYNIQLESAPASLVLNFPKEVNEGQDYQFTINVDSNTVKILENILIEVKYPFGFTYVEANPRPTYGNNIWRIDELESTGKYAVTVRGRLSGVTEEQKVFHTKVGLAGNRDQRSIGVLYDAGQSSVHLKRPFIDVELVIGEDASLEDYPLSFGEQARVDIVWENNLDSRVIDLEIVLTFSGNALDKSTVLAAKDGFYNSIDNTIFWDKRGAKELSVLEAGSSGEVQFSFRPLPPIVRGTLLRNPEIVFDVSVHGKRIADTGVPEEITSTISRRVSVVSDVQFAGRSVHFVGPFENLGPMPPRSEQTTTYTIIWTIINSSNDLENTQVRAKLPPYVEWLDQVDPGNEQLTYNPRGGELLWDIGDLAAGTGVLSGPKEVAFQIGFTPSITQINEVPEIILDAIFKGFDTYTNVEIKKTLIDVTIQLANDPIYIFQMGTVVP